MAIQRMTVVMLRGKLAAWAGKVCAEKSDRAMKKLLALLRRHAMDSRVAYFSEHMDSWSIGHQVFLQILPNVKIVDVGWHSMQLIRFKSRRDVNTLKHKINRLPRFSDEVEWTRHRIEEALKCAFVLPALLLIAREVYTTSDDDSEIACDSRQLPDWVERLK